MTHVLISAVRNILGEQITNDKFVYDAAIPDLGSTSAGYEDDIKAASLRRWNSRIIVVASPSSKVWVRLAVLWSVIINNTLKAELVNQYKFQTNKELNLAIQEFAYL